MTKEGKKPLGLELIKELTDGLTIPFFVIGGIKQNDISLLKKNRLKKIAIVSEIANSENPQEKAIMLIKQLENEN